MFLNLTIEELFRIFSDGARRCEMARLAGGIPHEDVVGKGAFVPDGWMLDEATNFWLPPEVQLNARTH